MKILNIIDGWKAFFFKENNYIAKLRAEECKKCPEAGVGKFEIILKDEVEEIQGLKCDACGCPLSAKLRSKKEKCPLKKW